MTYKIRRRSGCRYENIKIVPPLFLAYIYNGFGKELSCDFAKVKQIVLINLPVIKCSTKAAHIFLFRPSLYTTSE